MAALAASLTACAPKANFDSLTAPISPAPSIAPPHDPAQSCRGHRRRRARARPAWSLVSQPPTPTQRQFVMPNVAAVKCCHGLVTQRPADVVDRSRTKHASDRQRRGCFGGRGDSHCRSQSRPAVSPYERAHPCDERRGTDTGCAAGHAVPAIEPGVALGGGACPARSTLGCSSAVSAQRRCGIASPSDRDARDFVAGVAGVLERTSSATGRPTVAFHCSPFAVRARSCASSRSFSSSPRGRSMAPTSICRTRLRWRTSSSPDC